MVMMTEMMEMLMLMMVMVIMETTWSEHAPIVTELLSQEGN